MCPWALLKPSEIWESEGIVGICTLGCKAAVSQKGLVDCACAKVLSNHVSAGASKGGDGGRADMETSRIPTEINIDADFQAVRSFRDPSVQSLRFTEEEDKF